jgi:hypothetical protein
LDLVADNYYDTRERAAFFASATKSDSRAMNDQSISVETDTWPIKQAIAVATHRRVPAGAVGAAAARGEAGEAFAGGR